MRAWISPAARAATVALGLTFAVACGGGDGSEINVETVEPNQGPLGGGQVVTISGDGFLAGGAAPNLALVGDMLTTEVMALSDKEIQIVTPPGTEPGAVDVFIFNSNGFGMAAEAYTYAEPPSITSVDPPAGDWTGGDEVTITGSGFQELSAGPATITFDGRPAIDVVIESDTELTATVPQGRPFALATVSITNDRGYGSLDEAYEYTASVDNALIGVSGRGFFNSGQQPEPSRGIYFIDVATGESALAHAFGELNLSINGLEADSDGTIYATGPQENMLFTLDVQRGEFTPVGPFILFGKGGTPSHPASPTFIDGALYTVDRQLGPVTIDTETGAYTQLDVSNPPTSGSRGLAYNGTSLFWLTDSRLYELNPNTFAVIGEPHPLPLERAAGLTFHNGDLYVSERMFTLGKGGSPNRSKIWKIDDETFAVSQVADVPGGIHALVTAQ